MSIWSSTPAPIRPAAPTAVHNSVISAWGCYRIPHLRIKGRCVYTNKVPAGHTRATGKIQTTWGIECTMDSVARQMGIDPYEFRKKNVLLRGDFVCQGHAVDGHGLSRSDGGGHYGHRLGWPVESHAVTRAAANGLNGCADTAWR